MPNDVTDRGYELPHPDNVASSDVVRIRNALGSVDSDVREVWDYNAQQNLESTIELWS
tara:strand:+ start:524 stop:697 length:174 start_codon:yes stop_codon:yes gene_type:complete